MSDKENSVSELIKRFNDLAKQHFQMQQELEEIKSRIVEIQKPEDSVSKTSNENVKGAEESISKENLKEQITQQQSPVQSDKTKKQESRKLSSPFKKNKASGFNLEKFIGENLISKIGILIIIIGVVIGAKYAIDHDLINPLTRIILGYLVGGGLVAFALKLKKNFVDLSAVLLSGSMAVFYFITYAAYSFYSIFPQTGAFLLMVLFTAFTVYSAIMYNRQVIAHIGLLGAYSVPFLLSENSGRVEIMFTYMALINTGILIIAFMRKWKSLYYASFGITWLIFLSWYAAKYQHSEHFVIGMTFSLVFFLIFYATFLSYKLVKKEAFSFLDVIMLTINSFVFYGVGYAMLSLRKETSEFLGLFSLCNAIFHFIFALVIRNRKESDDRLFYLVLAMVMTFLAIAIPVQLEGTWVTSLWLVQATVMYAIGKSKNINWYEYMSYPLMILGFFSLYQDWSDSYTWGYRVFFDDNQEIIAVKAFLNKNFLGSFIGILAFGIITWMSRKYAVVQSNLHELIRFCQNWIPGILFITIAYLGIRFEIAEIYNYEYRLNQTLHPDLYYSGKSIKYFGSVVLTIYSLCFGSLLALISLLKIKKPAISYASISLLVLFQFTFLAATLYQLSELREFYLSPDTTEPYSGSANLLIRYVVLFVNFLALYLVRLLFIRKVVNPNGLKFFRLFLHLNLVWVGASELLQWMDMMSVGNSYKLVLSIYLGLYALLMIALGIKQKMFSVRIGAIVLFAGTIIKLFTYDIAHLDTIPKTITFVVIGVILLIVSFLYTKYKNLIFDEDDLSEVKSIDESGYSTGKEEKTTPDDNNKL